jgi:hypothetical protein
MGVHQGKLRAGAGAVQAHAADTDGGQNRKKIRAHPVPRRSENGKEMRLCMRLEASEAIGYARERRLDGLSGRILGLLFAGGGAVAVVSAVLQYGHLVVQKREQPRLGRLGHHGEPERYPRGPGKGQRPS